ncbi:putative non-specific serine/threonine protein kinase [Helianthus debilis subsp. tardiflorus]
MENSLSHMASFIAFVCTLSLAFGTAKSQSNVTLGSSIKPTGATTSWLSPSGLFAFGFFPQTDGYAVGVYIAGIPERTVVWMASRNNLPLSKNANLRFTSDGRLAVCDTCVTSTIKQMPNQ